MVARNAKSYTLYLTLMAKMWGPGAEQGGIIQASSCKLDLKESYYRMSQPQAYPLAQDQQSHPLINTQSSTQDNAEVIPERLSLNCSDFDLMKVA
nr:putative histone-arginine methyltransferase 1.3 [Quercus suber]